MKLQTARIPAGVMVTDIVGQPVIANHSAQEATLLFLDLVPPANWAHPCAYLLVHGPGEVEVAKHHWPPHDSIPLSPEVLLS